MDGEPWVQFGPVTLRKASRKLDFCIHSLTRESWKGINFEKNQ